MTTTENSVNPESFPLTFEMNNNCKKKLHLTDVEFNNRGITYFKRKNKKNIWTSSFDDYYVELFTDIQINHPDVIEQIFDLLYQQAALYEQQLQMNQTMKERHDLLIKIQRKMLNKLWKENGPIDIEMPDQWIYFIRSQRGFHLYFI
jgi:hypothetical protein